MKRKMLALAVTSLMAFGGTAVVSSADPGPNGNNDHGLCTAFFNGKKKGHDNENAGGNGNGNGRQPGENPPPFQSLIETAEANDQSVYEFCQAAGISGNPDENGRYPDCFDGDDQTGHDENNACPTEDDS